jgi:hypothetical protein
MSKTNKASLELMEMLHGKLAAKYLDVLENTPLEELSPAYLTSISKFLKDNHIEAGIGNADMTDLEKAMRDMENLPYDGEVPPEYKQ